MSSPTSGANNLFDGMEIPILSPPVQDHRLIDLTSDNNELERNDNLLKDYFGEVSADNVFHDNFLIDFPSDNNGNPE